MLVSGDFIRAQKKYGQPFEFSNYAKLIFSANEIPQSEDIRGQNLTHFVLESPSSLDCSPRSSIPDVGFGKSHCFFSLAIF